MNSTFIASLSRYALPIAIILISTFGVMRWGYQDFDISSFIVAGDRITPADQHNYPIRILENSTGYDGQHFYHLALDPCLRDSTVYHDVNKYGYRKQRILYPILSYILSFGNGSWVPYTLVLVNWLAFVLFFIANSKILTYLKRPPYYLFILALFTGPYIAFSRDMAEVLNLSLLSWVVWFLLKRQFLGLIICSTLALLTREDSVLVVFPVLLFYFMNSIRTSDNHSKILKLAGCIFPIVILGAWKFYLLMNYGQMSPTQFGVIPGWGFVSGIKDIMSGNIYASQKSSTSLMLFALYCSMYLFWHIWTALYTASVIELKKWSHKEIDVQKVLTVCFALWVIMALFFNHVIYRSDLGFGRILSTLMWICFVILAINVKKWNILYLLFTTITCLVVLSRLIVFP